MHRLRKIAEGNYYNAQEIAEKNRRLAEETGNTDQCVGFIWNDHFIIDPFMDETGRFSVDPIEYYGDAFKSSDFAK